MESFSVVIPVYNEEKILADSVEGLARKLKQKWFKRWRWEIILVENGSTDGTWDICTELTSKNKLIKLGRLKSACYGGAVKWGLKKARHNFLVVFNVDFWDVEFLKKALELIKGCDVVVGSKTLIAAKDLRPWHRKQISYWFNVFLRAIFNYPGTDTHGLKVLRRSQVLPLLDGCGAERELFDTELLLKAARRGLILTELPLRVREIRPTRYNNWRRAWNTMKDLGNIFYYRYVAKNDHYRG